MHKTLLVASLLISFGLMQSCSRKITPEKKEETARIEAEKVEAAKAEEEAKAAAAVKRAPVVKPVVKTATPKSITVNDRAAKKTVDGRYYYDLEGKRYWRNNKDGKYYLYYKGMFSNKDFQ